MLTGVRTLSTMHLCRSLEAFLSCQALLSCYHDSVEGTWLQPLAVELRATLPRSAPSFQLLVRGPTCKATAKMCDEETSMFLHSDTQRD